MPWWPEDNEPKKSQHPWWVAVPKTGKIHHMATKVDAQNRAKLLYDNGHVAVIVIQADTREEARTKAREEYARYAAMPNAEWNE